MGKNAWNVYNEDEEELSATGEIKAVCRRRIFDFGAFF
jgi:hypothetical protein